MAASQRARPKCTKRKQLAETKSKSNRVSKAARSTSASRPSRSRQTVYGPHFPFFNLPAELRNNVYEKVFDELPEVYLTTRTRSNLASRSALPRVSRQIRDEFLPMMYICAGEVIARVTDLNFGHVVTFLNRLSDAEMNALIETSSSRKVKIELKFTSRFRRMYRPWMSSHLPQSPHRWINYLPQTLHRWINRLEHPTKRGTKIDASYIVAESTQNLEDLRSGLQYLHYRVKRKDDEVRKILRAISEWLDRS